MFTGDKAKYLNDSKKSFLLHQSDMLFTLTMKKSFSKENLLNLIVKMIMLNETTDLNLSNLSKLLGFMKIQNMYIFFS